MDRTRMILINVQGQRVWIRVGAIESIKERDDGRADIYLLDGSGDNHYTSDETIDEILYQLGVEV